MTSRRQTGSLHPSDRALWGILAPQDPRTVSHAAVERHLDGCARCLERLQDLGTRGIAAEILAHEQTLQSRPPRVLRDMALVGPVRRTDVARALVELSIPHLLVHPEVPVSLLSREVAQADEQRAYVLGLLGRSRLRDPLRSRIEEILDQTLAAGEPGGEGSLALARSGIDLSLALAPREGVALVWRGWVAVAESSPTEAEAWWERVPQATKAPSCVASALGNRGTLAFLQGNLRRARQVKRKLLRSAVPVEALRGKLDLAVILVREGEKADARQVLEGIQAQEIAACEGGAEYAREYGRDLLPLARRGSKWLALLEAGLRAPGEECVGST